MLRQLYGYIYIPYRYNGYPSRSKIEENSMAARKPLLGPAPDHPELDRLLEQARTVQVTDEQLQEQRISFAYGNALESANITKESVRDASKSLRMNIKKS